jgi:hypothetical protein
MAIENGGGAFLEATKAYTAVGHPLPRLDRRTDRATDIRGAECWLVSRDLS